jgi:hypothetical protein
MTRCAAVPVGEQLLAAVLHGHWRTTKLIAALDHLAVR